jgi:hypothetical protein
MLTSEGEKSYDHLNNVENNLLKFSTLERGALFFIMAACYFCNVVIGLNTINVQ